MWYFVPDGRYPNEQLNIVNGDDCNCCIPISTGEFNCSKRIERGTEIL